MLAAEDGLTLPGWRDFERTIALVLDGHASESKDVFDVWLERPGGRPPHYGLSCKMRGELARIDRDGRVTIEVSNSAGKFWRHLAASNLTQQNYIAHPAKAGPRLVQLVRAWHHDEAERRSIDLSHSFYLVLSWSKAGVYQMHQFPLELFAENSLKWHVPAKATSGSGKARRLCGDDAEGTMVEWYGESGGQLKFYPLAGTAVWASPRFELEALPARVTCGIAAKVRQYFPKLWQRACGD
jgi:hypothetical protein